MVLSIILSFKNRILFISSVFTVSVLIIWKVLASRKRKPISLVPHSAGLRRPNHNHIRAHHHRRLRPISNLLSDYSITLVDNEHDCERFLSERAAVLSPSSRSTYCPSIVGLDCEWVNRDGVVSSPVALLQLAFPDSQCLLVRVFRMDLLGPHLSDLLTNRSVLKLGVGISNDVQRLSAAFGVETSGYVDLQHVAVRCGVRCNTGLQSLSRELLSLEVDKAFHVQCGDWEAKELNKRQVDYAAADAIVALHIVRALVELKLAQQDKRESLAGYTGTYYPSSMSIGKPSLQCPESLEQWLKEEENVMCLMSLCQGIVEVPYKQGRRSSQQSTSEDVAVSSRRTSAYSVRRTRLYHNCKLLAPDGQLLSTIDKRKLEWYLQKELGTLVSEEPLTLKLHFEPAGRPGEDRNYYLQNKENICVVCGTDENCVRKNIVPHEYRRLFPPKLKEHLSHDVLLMCVLCHQVANVHNARLKQEIECEFNMPVKSSQKFKDDPRLLKVKNHARALLKHNDKLPDDRKKELLETLADHFDCDVSEINKSLIESASQVDPKEMNANYIAHADTVVKALLEENRVLEFQRQWRQHFLDTMKPRFLPELWCVDHNPS